MKLELVYVLMGVSGTSSAPLAVATSIEQAVTIANDGVEHNNPYTQLYLSRVFVDQSPDLDLGNVDIEWDDGAEEWVTDYEGVL